MREKTTYIAYDGKKFDSSVECKKYEDSILNEIYSEELLCYDRYGKRIEDVTKSSFLDCSYYIIFKSEKALNYFNEKSKYYGYPIVHNDNNTYPLAVCYVDEDEWIPIFEGINNMKKKIELLEKIANM